MQPNADLVHQESRVPGIVILVTVVYVGHYDLVELFRGVGSNVAPDGPGL
jgi:hypothetical protein